jgi:hypothetical protein
LIVQQQQQQKTRLDELSGRRQQGDPIGRIFADSARVARWFIFKPKNPNLGKFWRALEWNMFVYFMTICNIL